MNVEHWISLIENRIQQDFLIQQVFEKKSYFPDGDFGDLFRFEFESSCKFGTLECWSNGSVSIDFIDINGEGEYFVFFLST